MPLGMPLSAWSVEVGRMSPPGAVMSTADPKFEYGARAPVRPLAATATTLRQLAGLDVDAWAVSFPAAATTSEPRAVAASMALWNVAGQAPAPPRLRLITRAGFGLAGTPATLPPEAQMMASAMSESCPPQGPSTRTGRILACGAMPAIPSPLLLAAAAMMPATWV